MDKKTLKIKAEFWEIKNEIWNFEQGKERQKQYRVALIKAIENYFILTLSLLLSNRIFFEMSPGLRLCFVLIVCYPLFSLLCWDGKRLYEIRKQKGIQCYGNQEHYKGFCFVNLSNKSIGNQEDKDQRLEDFVIVHGISYRMIREDQI